MGDEGSPPSQTIAITTDTTNGFNIASLVVEPDYTVSLYVDSQPFFNVSAAFANTPTQLYNPNVWQLWQASWSLSSVPFVTGTGTSTHVTNFIGVTASVWLEGTLVINGAFGTSGVSIGTGSDVGAPLINEYAFSCPPGDGYLAEIWATDSFLGTTTFPFIGSPPGGAARMTQGVFEYAATKPSRNVRMTQGVVEIPMRPTHRNMRMTQGVVEIIKKGGAAEGWVVQEV
jgi:hypothetical protein